LSIEFRGETIFLSFLATTKRSGIFSRGAKQVRPRVSREASPKTCNYVINKFLLRVSAARPIRFLDVDSMIMFATFSFLPLRQQSIESKTVIIPCYLFKRVFIAIFGRPNRLELLLLVHVNVGNHFRFFNSGRKSNATGSQAARGEMHKSIAGERCELAVIDVEFNYPRQLVSPLRYLCVT
jgi:hypothetical protein